jgi:OOP family OmpA-OmpF porin
MKQHLSWAYAAVLSIAVLLALPFVASAQGFSLNRFDPAEHGSNWFSGESLDLRGHLRPAAGLTLDWAYKPLVAYDEDGDEIGPLIESQLFAHLGGGLILWDRVRVGLNVPIALISQGDAVAINGVTLEAQDGASLGDIRLGVDVRLLGEYGDIVTLAAGVQLHLPTGDSDAFTGDGGVRLTPRLMVAGDIGIFAYSARMGIAVRTGVDDSEGVSTGSELAFVGTAGVRVLDKKLLIGPELWGTTVMDDFFGKQATPFELIFGGHYTAGDFIFALGVGPGLTRGLGAPGVRVLGSVEWFPAIDEAKPAPEPEPEDRDGDGILDVNDACPDDKGVASDDPEKNGCPLPKDKDGDGIIDSEDACPNEKGVETDDPDTHGCPPDRDGDGVYDVDDACPDVKGIASDDPKQNGCPGDRDDDTIVDPEDACPDNAGPPNEDKSKHGCPAARVEKGQIKIIERIEFKSGSDKILPESFGIMEAVRAILAEHDEITRIAIEGHTDSVGKPESNKKLSQRRAESVMKWLTQKGIKRERLEAQGFGMERPIADNDSDEGKQKNRRVEFHIRTVNGEPVDSENSTEVEE